MKKTYLLDTQAVLYWLSGSKKLGPRARKVMEDGRSELLLSVVSTWEIGIKHAIGKLTLPAAPERYLPGKLQEHGFTLITLEHLEALAAAALPMHHDDPFDRALIAQAVIRKATLISGDSAFDDYQVETLW
jgi:PIN domain nuclease of toxin-antitoxin system